MNSHIRYYLNWAPRPNSKRHVVQIRDDIGNAIATFFHMRDAEAWCAAQCAS